ncbi:MAG: VOC family protein [Chloroflexi bacterium]|nr:VOC family protein [Chloroflexota bacterium]
MSECKDKVQIISGLAHVCFTVSDLQASVDFYCGKLGMTKAFEFRRPDGTWHGQYIHAGGRNFIELFVGTLGEPAEGQSYRHICLEVADIEETVAVLRQRGAEVTEIKMGGDGSYQAWLADPDGNRIELHQYMPDSKQTPYLA